MKEPVQGEPQAFDGAFFRSMLDDIERYRLGNITFPALVSVLSVAIQSLGEPQAAIVLKDKWWALEEVNALALDQGSLRPLAANVAIADHALEEIVTYIKQRLALG